MKHIIFCKKLYFPLYKWSIYRKNERVKLFSCLCKLGCYCYLLQGTRFSVLNVLPNGSSVYSMTILPSRRLRQGLMNAKLKYESRIHKGMWCFS